ncbi:linoleoyl-CoA desaturase activity protein [Mortierella alpina]|uniref:Linoleoyl-CoA desaturase activity protein n=1 Tax=Mortierella alpina TaxID=64518 RepID=A0A9P6IS40_MORAP|nr:linoleoyl-CoA desaturase activity protein [Mortierella alpina]
MVSESSVLLDLQEPQQRSWLELALDTLGTYHSERIWHSNHHKATGHMTKDWVFVSKIHSQVGLPYKESAAAAVQEEISWSAYLILNDSGQDYDRWASHLHRYSRIFEPRNFLDIIISVLGVSAALGARINASMQLSLLTATNYYIIPCLSINFWLVLIAFLQYTDPKLPHYLEGAWKFQRGALCTVGRSFGKFLDHMFHGVVYTHVAHHLFSQM